MFRRLLVANRGEVAVRIARAARSLDIEPVGVASEADLLPKALELSRELGKKGRPILTQLKRGLYGDAARVLGFESE